MSAYFAGDVCCWVDVSIPSRFGLPHQFYISATSVRTEVIGIAWCIHLLHCIWFAHRTICNAADHCHSCVLAIRSCVWAFETCLSVYDIHPTLTEFDVNTTYMYMASCCTGSNMLKVLVNAQQ